MVRPSLAGRHHWPADIRRPSAAAGLQCSAPSPPRQPGAAMGIRRCPNTGKLSWHAPRATISTTSSSSARDAPLARRQSGPQTPRSKLRAGASRATPPLQRRAPRRALPPADAASSALTRIRRGIKPRPTCAPSACVASARASPTCRPTATSPSGPSSSPSTSSPRTCWTRRSSVTYLDSLYFQGKGIYIGRIVVYAASFCRQLNTWHARTLHRSKAALVG